MAKYGSDVGVKSGGLSGGLAEAKAGGEKKETTSTFTVAKQAEKQALKDKLIKPPADWVDPNPPVAEAPVAAAAMAAPTEDEFGDGFDDGAGGEAEFTNAMVPSAAKPTTKKRSPAYLRGNVAGRMFRRQYYVGNK